MALGNMALPDGSFDFIQVKEMSDEDADYIADWMAKACSRTDCFKYLAIGKSYDEDPEAHRLFARSNIDRGSIDGIHFVNKTFTAFRTVFLPGQKDRRLDVDWKTPNDVHWLKFVERCGGPDSLKERMAAKAKAVDTELLSLYGEDRGVEFYKTSGFAVHPQYQGRGIGTALHRYIAAEAGKAGKKWFFLSQQFNVPYYNRIGCKIVGSPIPTGLDEHGRQRYPDGNDYMRVCEVNP